MPSLVDLIGSSIIIRSVPIDEQHPAMVKLHAVESSGIWIESSKAIESMLQTLNRTSAPKTLIFFLPFAQIAWIMSTLDVPYISDSIMK